MSAYRVICNKKYFEKTKLDLAVIYYGEDANDTTETKDAEDAAAELLSLRLERDKLREALKQIVEGLSEESGCYCEMGFAPNGEPYHAISCTEMLLVIAEKALGE